MNLKPIPLAYRAMGNGTPIIILHGLFGLSDNWNGIAKVLSKQYQIICVDLRNHGQSPHSEAFSISLMAEDVYELIKQLLPDKAIVVGHSMGGKVAMQLAIDHPNIIQKLLVVDIGVKFYPPHHQTILFALQQLDFNTLKSRAEAQSILQFYINDASVVQFLLKNIYWPNPERMALRFNLSAISAHISEVGKAIEGRCNDVEAAFLFGENSDYVLPHDFAGIRDVFPKAQFYPVAGAGHWVHAEKPKEFIQLLELFVNKV